MPRIARQKTIDSVYHIMCRSISEVDLFRDEDDKIKYLNLLKEYKEILAFKIYGYCLMDNHCHFIIDVNGADISTIFHGINYKYAMYFNKKYKRHGHLFQDRFKSKIIDDNNYLITVSGYIHANPLDIEEYKERVEDYKYSSLGIYLGTRKDEYDLIDTEFVMSQFSNKEVNARKLYLEFTKQCVDENIGADIDFKNEGTMYLSQRKILLRNHSVEKIIKFLVEKLKISEGSLRIKNSRDTVNQRALFTLLMRCFCNYKNRDICGVIGNISQSRVSMLCSIGKNLICNDVKYKGLINEFIAY